MSRYPAFDPARLTTRSLEERRNKVGLSDLLALPVPSGREEIEQRLPDIENQEAFRQFGRLVRLAGDAGRPLVWMLGAHVIKVGCSPLVIDLAERGFISCVAMNGAGMIHDFELALIGATSEDVEENLTDGAFGMWEETGALLHQAAREARADGLGYGEGAGRFIDRLDPPHKEASLLWRLWKAEVPVTLHSAIGTEIIHQHPDMDGALVGELTWRDFLIFTGQISTLCSGAAVLNVGSAVILPEVFLKALSMVRNAGFDASGFHAANFDMIDHYRPRVNVVSRPVSSGGTGNIFLGMHEVLLPALFELIIAEPGPQEED